MVIAACVLQEGIYDAFVDAVTKKVGEFKQGGGLDPSTTLGPLIGHSAVDRVRRAHLLHKAAEQMERQLPHNALSSALPELTGS